MTAGANEGERNTDAHVQGNGLIRFSPGMFSALLAFLDQGDEVICIEPFFDQYLASIIFNGGKPVYVPLHPPEGDGRKSGADWKLDYDEFE